MSGRIVSPRYSVHPGLYSLANPPRYSLPPVHDYYRAKVKYSQDRSDNFDFHPMWSRSNSPYNAQFAAFSGPYYFRSYADNRKWQLMMVKVIGNKKTPEGVKEKVAKPKFDKKEREIWNN
jgi:hypothetical protein